MTTTTNEPPRSTSITERTTLHELELELALLGSPTVTLAVRSSRSLTRSIVLHSKTHGFHFGLGATIATALQEAACSLRDKLTKSILEQRAASPPTTGNENNP